MDLFSRIKPGHHALNPGSPVDFFPMPGATWDDVRKAEQELLNALGGIDNLANKRNAVARKNWRKFGVDPVTWY